MKKLTISEKKQIITNWADEMDRLWDIYPEKVDEYKNIIEEGIEKNWPEALHAKGYACYGGNSVYACDWDESKKCIEKLAELTEDPFCYNTLGYIYYYGRCNGGVPQYDEAFKCFSIGNACGIFESTYKLADMFLNGYGISKNTKAAFELINRIYDDTAEIFAAQNFEGKFADVALRMGYFFEKGVGVEKSEIDAYALYLQAALAIKKRMDLIDYYGDEKVEASIDKALKRVEKKIPQDFFEKSIDIDVPGPIGDILAHSAAVEISIKQKGEQYYLAGKGIADDQGATGMAFLTLPEFKMCTFIKKAELLLKGPEFLYKEMADKLYATSIHYNEDDDTWDFIDGEKTVLRFRCKGFVYKKPRF